MKLFFIITVFSWATVCLAVRQRIEFYTGANCTGEAVILESKAPDFHAEAPRILGHRSSFLFVGVWGVYDSENYGFGGPAFANTTAGCGNTYRTISSLRYLGPPDTTTDSISLYKGIYASLQEITVTSQYSNIPFAPMTIFSTGTSSWTFYTGRYWDGNATCFVPPNPPTDGWYTYLGYVNSSLSNVGSIIKGCKSSRIDQYFFP